VQQFPELGTIFAFSEFIPPPPCVFLKGKFARNPAWSFAVSSLRVTGSLCTSAAKFLAVRRSRIAAFCLFFLALPAVRVFAEQNAHTMPHGESVEREEIFFAALGEASLNARSGLAGGGGGAIGFGDGTAFGFKFLFNGGEGPLRVLEAVLFFRCYLPSLRGNEGFFAQAEFGNSIIHEGDRWPGDFYGGLTLGWRFLFRDRWFLEPALRAGYPFITGGGVGVGIRL
jgi:hypothetical protein